MCRGDDPELWFAHPGTAEAREAQRVCGLCPVQSACAAYAAANRTPFGIWGGVQRNKQGEVKRTASGRQCVPDGSRNQWATMPPEQKQKRAGRERERRRIKREAMTPEERAAHLELRRLRERTAKATAGKGEGNGES